MQNKIFVIVEDIKSFLLFYRENTNLEKKYFFFTTSYYVYNFLKKKDIDVELSDKFIKTKDFDKIGNFSFKFSKELEGITNNICKWRISYNIGSAISQSVFLFFNTYCFKYLILKRIIEKTNKYKSKLIVLGFSKKNLNSFKIDRTENIFLLFAKKINSNNLEYIDYSDIFKHRKKVNGYSGEFKKNILNKSFTFLDNSFNSIIFKISKKIFYSLYSNPFSKNLTYIYGENYSFIDNFTKIFLRSNKIIFLKKIPKMNINNHNLLDNEIKETLFKCYKDISQNYDEIYLKDDLIFKIFFQNYTNVLKSIESNFEDFIKLFSKLLKKNNKKNFLFFNGFYSIEEKLFEEFCLKKNVITVGFEHGATTSISNFRKIYDYFHGSKKSSLGIYYTKRAKEFMDTVESEQSKLVSGVPKRYNKNLIFDNKITNYFLKKILKLPTDKNLILIIADIDVNNFILTPQRDTNYKYIKKTKILIKYIKKKFKNHHIVIKFYPGKRFVDPYYFKDEMDHKISRLQNIDLRFITNIFDKIFTTSTDSGLGWALSSKKELFFKSFYWAKSDFVYKDRYNLDKRSLIRIKRNDFIFKEDKKLIEKIYEKK